MYAFVITISVIWHSITPIKFYVVSKERYREIELGACLAAGRDATLELRDHIWMRYQKRAKVKDLSVECVEWVTVES